MSKVNHKVQISIVLVNNFHTLESHRIDIYNTDGCSVTRVCTPTSGNFTCSETDRCSVTHVCTPTRRNFTCSETDGCSVTQSARQLQAPSRAVKLKGL